MMAVFADARVISDVTMTVPGAMPNIILLFYYHLLFAFACQRRRDAHS